MSAAKGQYTAETVTLAEGMIRTIRLTADGRLMVDMSGASAPTGVATAALQTTGNTSLSNIDSDLELLKQPTRAVSVTASDATDTTSTATKGCWVGTGGDLAVKFVGDSAGSAVTLKNVPSGTYVPGAFCRIMSTNTTASNIVSFYGP